ncbi:MAG: cysteine biosynthesis protein CysZ, partial [Nitratireductor sp.]
MILDAARAAAAQLFTAEFRQVFLKSLGLTLLALVALWFGLSGLFDTFAMPWIDELLPGFPAWAGWLGFVTALLFGLGLAIGLALLV